MFFIDNNVKKILKKPVLSKKDFKYRL